MKKPEAKFEIIERTDGQKSERVKFRGEYAQVSFNDSGRFTIRLVHPFVEVTPNGDEPPKKERIMSDTLLVFDEQISSKIWRFVSDMLGKPPYHLAG